MKQIHGQISWKTQPARWSLQMSHYNSVTLPSFPILAVLIYSELVSRDKINWAKTAAFSYNCLCRKGLLSISSCESLPSSLKSTLTLVAANKRDLKYGSPGTSCVKCNILMYYIALSNTQHMLCMFHFGAPFFPSTLDRALFPQHVPVPGKPQLLGLWSWSRGREGLRFSENTLWINIIQRMAECPQNIFEPACYVLIQFPIEMRVL